MDANNIQHKTKKQQKFKRSKKSHRFHVYPQLTAQKYFNHIKRLKAKDIKLIGLGPRAVAVYNFIYHTNNYLDLCFYSSATMAYKLCLSQSTVKRALKDLKKAGFIMQRCIRKIGHNQVTDRWISPEHEKDNNLRRIISLLSFTVAMAVTSFSRIEPRIFNEFIYYQNQSDQSVILLALKGDRTADHVDEHTNRMPSSEFSDLISPYFIQSVSSDKKDEKAMIPDYILQIKSVHFTLAGQACVAAFSERIVRAADAKMLRTSKSISNRAAYFFKICHELCKERNVLPDFDAADELHKKLNTNDRMPMMETLGKNPQLTDLMDSVPTVRKPLRTGKPDNFNCPCHYRRKFNPDYVCYGSWCAQQELEDAQALAGSNS